MHAVVGVLSDDTDPMVTVMKLEKAPQETYADIGGEARHLANPGICLMMIYNCFLFKLPSLKLDHHLCYLLISSFLVSKT